jgi:hypothetical protein
MYADALPLQVTDLPAAVADGPAVTVKVETLVVG